MKLYFEREGWHQTELSKTCSSVCERLSKRFKVQTRTDERAGSNDQLALVVVMLGASQPQVLNRFDELGDFVESTDLGRIVGEEVFMEDVDLLLDEAGDEGDST